MSRALKKEFFEKLNHADGIFHKFVELVKMDQSLDLELRGDCVEIYYRGGILFRIRESDADRVETTAEYLNFDSSVVGANLESICTVHPKIDYAIENVASYKQAIDFHMSAHRTDEKEFQQLIERSNNYISTAAGTDYYIADIEYAHNDKARDIAARFDMIALYWPSESGNRKSMQELPLTFIEVKYGDGALAGASGIKKHIADFIMLCKDKEAMEALCKDMTCVFRQKFDLGLIPGCSKLKHGVHVTDDDPRLLFIFGDHDPNSSIMVKEIQKAISKEDGRGNSHYIDKIYVASSSCMGYGLFAVKDKTYFYPSIRDFAEHR